MKKYILSHTGEASGPYEGLGEFGTSPVQDPEKAVYTDETMPFSTLLILGRVQAIHPNAAWVEKPE